MYRDVEEMLTRELREVADHVTVPPLPQLPTAPPPARLAWQPMLVAAALVLVALATVASLLRMDGGESPQPAPQPTDVATDDATEALPESVPTTLPTVAYVVDFRVYSGDFATPIEQAYGGLQSSAGDRWLARRQDGTWAYYDGVEVNPLDSVTIPQAPSLSPNGEYVAYVDDAGQVNGFETERGGEGMGLPAQVPAEDDDGVAVSVRVVTDDGWVIAGGRGVGVLWKPFVDGTTVDLTETAPGQQVAQATRAGIVAFDASGDARTPGDGSRVYLADVTADGEIVPVADLPSFAALDAAGDWVGWVPPGVIEGDVATYGEIQVRRIGGGDDGVLVPPAGYQFQTVSDFAFEDNQFLVAPVTDGEEQRWARCSPALQECVLLDTPSPSR